MENSKIRLNLKGDFELIIGSAPDVHVCIPSAAPKQAMIIRKGDRLFLRNLGDDAGMVQVNHRQIKPNRRIEITRYDEISIAGAIVNLSPKFFLGRDRVGIDTSPLHYTPAGRELVNGAYFQAKPGTFTALLGPAGCGKTLLLSLLGGYIAPTRGRIAIADNFDPRRDRNILRNFIGYVPQDDVLIPELTVRQSLNYRLWLKFHDMAAATRKFLIMDACRQVGVPPDRIDTFLDTVIGSPDGKRRGLSGGERRRANIAHELITRPLVLILDEPTSGLSSTDSAQILQLLNRLAHEESITVIASVHQPGTRAFPLFDNIMALSYGGKPAYYGPSDMAIEFFETATQTSCGDANPAEYILDQVTVPDKAAMLRERFEQVRSLDSRLPAPLPIEPPPDSSPAPAPRPHHTQRRSVTSWIAQWLTLTRRNFRALWSDKMTLAMSLLQAPLIGLMIFAAFHGMAGDAGGADEYGSKVKYYFDQTIAPLIKGGETINIDSEWAKAKEKAREDREFSGVHTVNRIAAVYFALTAAGIWFGILGSCREIVAEQHVLRRELRTCVRLMPFLGSKAVTQIILTGLQSGLLTLTVFLLPTGFNLIGWTRLWMILWLVSATAAALGLLVSCLSSTQRTALTMVPILMIPQLLFGGILRPPVNINDGLLLPRAISLATIERHGFQMLMELIPPYGNRALVPEVHIDGVGRYWELNIVNFKRTDPAELYFQPREQGDALTPVRMLAGGALLFLLAGYIALRCRFS